MTDLNTTAAAGMEFTDGAAESGVGAPVVAGPDADGVTSAEAGAATPQTPEAGTTEENTAGEAGAGSGKKGQSAADNAIARAARLAGEKAAEEKLRREYDEAVAALGVQNPLTGKPFASLADFTDYGEHLQAEAKGMSIDDFRRARDTEEERDKLSQELAAAKHELALSRAGAELALLKEKFPEISAESVFDLGDDFIRMRAAGVSAEAAYFATRQAAEANVKPVPPSMGTLSGEAAEKEYLSNEELDALTEKDLDKPGMLEKALKSLGQLRR